MQKFVPRVEVIKAGQMAPLLPTAPNLSSRSIQWQGIVFEKHVTEAIYIPKHEHPTNFLHLQTNGPVALEWQSQGRRHNQQMLPNSLMLLPQGTQDEVRWAGAVARTMLSLDQQMIEASAHEALPRGKIELVELWGFHDPHLLNLIFALQADLNDGSPAGRLYGEALATALAVYLQQRYAIQPVKTKIYHGGMPKYRLNRVLEFIAEHEAENIPLSQLAEIAGMSPHYFSELFRQSLKLSPHQFILRRRIERAKRLLHNPELSLLQISLDTGFQDQSHFTKVFRRLVGVTPMQYRAQL
jgi:AraC family transcriptional regulator